MAKTEKKQTFAPAILDAEEDSTSQSTHSYSAPPALPHMLQGESLQRVAENYLLYYASGDGHTARAKRYDLNHFLEFLANGNASVSKLRISHWTLQTTQSFVDHRLGLGETPATVARRLATIKHFGRTLAERVPGYINPAREVKAPVQQPSRPHGLSESEVAALRFAAASVETNGKSIFLQLRNQFLMELLLATGLRADEVRLLVIAQISEDFQWLKNVKTKGRKYRNVYLDSQIREQLKRYLEERESAIKEKFPAFSKLHPQEVNKVPVLVSFRGASLGAPESFGLASKSIWRIISSIGELAGANLDGPLGNLHPHRLRHTFAHGLLDSSKDVRLVAQALGHSDVRVTMRYTERTEEAIAQAIEKKITSS